MAPHLFLLKMEVKTDVAPSINHCCRPQNCSSESEIQQMALRFWKGPYGGSNQLSVKTGYDHHDHQDIKTYNLSVPKRLTLDVPNQSPPTQSVVQCRQRYCTLQGSVLFWLFVWLSLDIQSQHQGQPHWVLYWSQISSSETKTVADFNLQCQPSGKDIARSVLFWLSCGPPDSASTRTPSVKKLQIVLFGIGFHPDFIEGAHTSAQCLWS